MRDFNKLARSLIYALNFDFQSVIADRESGWQALDDCGGKAYAMATLFENKVGLSEDKWHYTLRYIDVAHGGHCTWHQTETMSVDELAALLEKLYH